MQRNVISIFPALANTIKRVSKRIIPEDRKEVLQLLIDFIQSKIDAGQQINLNFICTHNSRRSQFAQIWAQTAADYFGVPAKCFSGGVEVTAFNERAVASVKRSGFKVSSKGDANPFYSVTIGDDQHPVSAFSKLFDHPVNQVESFAAVMTCSHADENCPFIPGTEKRIPVHYEDPKDFDGTPQEEARYDERSMQIASEMFYMFSHIELH
ncbi:MAG: arsenate reductase [Cyclobacteriaceae bacterium]|nr:MAG: arsenate reductase [Cyclobacteriaceae bacterium]